MEREIKYTNDGKKVVVIGNLNAQEKIVQEIFIVNGQEVPSGENFVVKSLHDAPAVSWEEKRTKEIKEQYEKTRKQVDAELNDLRNRHRLQVASFRKLMEANGQMLRNMSEESFNTLSSFLSAEIKWIVKKGYGLPEIIEYGVENCSFDDNLRLLTLYGRSDGTLQWRLNNYSDGSGGNQDVYLFGDRDAAEKKYRELIINANYYTRDVLVVAKKLGLTLNPEKVAKYKAQTLSSLEEKIASVIKEQKRLSDELEETKAI